MVKYLLEVYSFPLKILFQCGKNLLGIIIKEEIKWKERSETKKIQEVQVKCTSWETAVEQGNTCLDLGFFNLFKVSLLHKKSVQVLQI